MQRLHSALRLVIYLFAIGLRLELALVNREANDDHLEVARMMLAEHRLPASGECWECFQPKLFHSAAAAILSAVANPELQLILIQLINCAAGIATIVLIERVLKDLPPASRLAALAVVALNPGFIAINAQATNDSFAIFFGSLALWAAARWQQEQSARVFVAVTLSALLAALSKGSNLAVLAVVALALGVSAVRTRSARGAAACVAFMLIALAVIPWAGQYLQNKQRTGSAFSTNIGEAPPAAFWSETSSWLPPPRLGRPGVTSIVHSYLSFRLIDLLEHPQTTGGYTSGYPRHRTSLWSQLYGRAHFAHFDYWPPSWRTDSPLVLTIGRALLLLALIPTLLLVLGAASLARPQWVYSLGAAAFLLFIIAYTYRYRDYATMKPQFIYPALPAFALFIGRGHQIAARWSRFLSLALVALCLLYVADIVSLIAQLTIG